MSEAWKRVRLRTFALLATAALAMSGGLSFNAPRSWGGDASGAVAIWPMLGRDSAHTGRSNFDTSTNAGNLKWQFKAGGWVASSPVIGSDGTIYVGNDETVAAGGGQSQGGGGNLYAISPQGSEKWRLPIYGSTQHISPATGPTERSTFGQKTFPVFSVILICMRLGPMDRRNGSFESARHQEVR
jgi:outer membrane protein assembly factor BamB